METAEVDLDKIQRIVEDVEGIVLLDLKGVQSTWKEHIDAIYAKMQELREICGLSDAS